METGEGASAGLEECVTEQQNNMVTAAAEGGEGVDILYGLYCGLLATAMPPTATLSCAPPKMVSFLLIHNLCFAHRHVLLIVL